MRNYIRIINVFSVPGCSVQEAAKDLCELAKSEQVIVQTEFNGIEMRIWDHDTPEKVTERYLERTEK